MHLAVPYSSFTVRCQASVYLSNWIRSNDRFVGM